MKTITIDKCLECGKDNLKDTGSRKLIYLDTYRADQEIVAQFPIYECQECRTLFVLR